MRIARAGILTAMLVLTLPAARVSAEEGSSSLHDALAGFRLEDAVKPGGDTPKSEAYYPLVEALKEKGYLDRDPAALVKALGEEISPSHKQFYHLLGITLYDQGYTDHAAAVLDVYQTGLMSVPEAVEKVRGVVDASKSALPADKSAELEAAARQLEARQAEAAKHHDRVTLKNGQSLYGRVAEEEFDGFWFETDEGTRVLLKNDEVKAILKGEGGSA